MLNLENVRQAQVSTKPFSYFLADNVLDAGTLAAVTRDFPQITQSGVFPLEELSAGKAFQNLIDDIKSADLETVVGNKLGVDLSGLPLMITVRGMCHRRDGRIHTDSEDKVVTCLLYLNEPWAEGSGRLRLLRNGRDIEDYITEIPPDGGTLVAFRRSDNSWHGHMPFEGPRRYVMFNWVRSEAALAKNVLRHRVSAGIKRLNPFR